MSTITLLMFAAAPGLPLLVLIVAWALGISRRGSAGRAPLRLLRSLVWAFGVLAAVYLSAGWVFLVKSDVQGFTLAACWPMVIFGTGAATALWHLRNLERQILARSRTTR